MRTIEITVKRVHRLFVVKTDATALTLTRLHVRDVERRMTAYLEVDLTGIGVVDMPDNTDLIGIEHIADTKDSSTKVTLR